ncbi:MAG: ABC transporter permease [Saprospiraceae bacterium]|nr:ABC transporter permease [Saprospiraceae bacterium]
MRVLLKIIFESFAQAFQQLRANKLRSFLSLLGITIGIFCIIGVQSAVDSLENNIRGSIEKLGDDVLYIQKMPWNEDPGENFWKYQRRPNPSYEDYELIRERVTSAGLADYHVFIGEKTLKFGSSSVEGAFVLAVTYDCADLFKLEFEKGRYLTPSEYHYGSNKVVIGHTVAEQLFGAIDPVGREVRLMGHKLEVVGVIKQSGRDILKVMNFDEVVLLGYSTASKISNIQNNNPFGSSVNVKAAEGVSIQELKDELTGALRAHRRLRPREENDFALNNVSLLANILDNIFGVINLAGLFIGIFALLVGMFSVANIMFVSVKERTSIIGIKKALGAKQYIILMEFLVESVILCIIGGLFGLLFVYLITIPLSAALPLDFYLSTGNIIYGIVWSVVVGVLSGFIPAYQAARMNPVDAMRS